MSRGEARGNEEGERTKVLEKLKRAMVRKGQMLMEERGVRASQSAEVVWTAAVPVETKEKNWEVSFSVEGSSRDVRRTGEGDVEGIAYRLPTRWQRRPLLPHYCFVFLRALNVGHWGENELGLHSLRNRAWSSRAPSNPTAAPGNSYAQPHTSSPFSLKATPAEILCNLTPHVSMA
ncbi:hypothetical protein PQX77_014505 [Marasmius sp. AFHP31]|nr:hypothetical protein PQX77_014505 [Marasmius sp. AFHP31]